MPRRIDEMQGVPFPFDPDVLGFDRDTSFAFQIHRIEILGAHGPRFDSASDLQNPVRQCGFSMINMRDDRKVSYPC